MEEEQLSQTYWKVQKNFLFLESLGARWALSSLSGPQAREENISHSPVLPSYRPSQGGGPGGDTGRL